MGSSWNRSLAVLCVLALAGCFGNFWWTSHVVNSNHARWCASIGYIGTLPLVSVPAGKPREATEAREVNAMIIHFRERAQQLSCDQQKG